jgi:hypothetical protein
VDGMRVVHLGVFSFCCGAKSGASYSVSSPVAHAGEGGGEGSMLSERRLHF